MADWKDCKWGDLATLEYGKGLTNYLRTDGKYPVYGTNGKIGTADSFLCATSSLIIGRKGAYRGVHYSREPFFVIDTAFYLKPKVTDLDITFAYYQLLTIDINGMDSGSAIPSTSREDFYDIDISLPPLSEQQAIAEVLSSLDTKIDLLHRQNKTLEAMAETLFRQWFVEEAEESWEIGKLGDFIEIKHGYAFKGANIVADETDKILVTPGNFKIGGGFNFHKYKYFNSEEFLVTYVLEEGDFVVTMTDLSQDNDTLGYPAFIPEIKGKRLLHNQRVGKVLFRENCAGKKFFLYNLMKSAEYRHYVLGNSSGMAVAHTSPSAICGFDFNIPSDSLIAKFEEQAKNFYEKERSNQKQIQRLSKLRDELLPKLMSGDEVRVKQVMR